MNGVAALEQLGPKGKHAAACTLVRQQVALHGRPDVEGMQRIHATLESNRALCEYILSEAFRREVPTLDELRALETSS